MTEAQLTTKVLKKIKKDDPQAFVWKISDRVRGGIPDALVITETRTEWLEFKVGDPKDVDKLVRPLQKHVIQQLMNVGEQVWVVVFHKGKAHYFLLADDGSRFVEMFEDARPF